MKILVTAFEPFDNNNLNYSNDVLKRIGSLKEVLKITLPVEYYNSFNMLKTQIKENNPDIIILLGEARSYPAVGFEIIGINEFSKKADNANYLPSSRVIIEGGDDGIFSSLDYEQFATSFEKVNAKYFKSYTAGTYVCNSLLYQTLNYLKSQDSKTKCGFIHIPLLEKEDIDVIVRGFNEYLTTLISR